MDLTLARIAAAHGLRGEVRLDLRTDDPEARLAPGTTLATDPPGAGPLTITRVRRERHAWFVTFAEISDRTAAEGARGVLLVGPPSPPEEDAWYAHELVGLTAELADGTVVGRIEGLEHLPAQDALVLREPTGERTLVPFVRAIVPVVDVAGRRVVLTPPGGLLAHVPAPADDAGHEA